MNMVYVLFFIINYITSANIYIRYRSLQDDMGRGVRIGSDDGGSGSSGRASRGRTSDAHRRPTEPFHHSGDVSRPPRLPRPRPAYKLRNEDDDDDVLGSPLTTAMPSDGPCKTLPVGHQVSYRSDGDPNREPIF